MPPAGIRNECFCRWYTLSVIVSFTASRNTYSSVIPRTFMCTGCGLIVSTTFFWSHRAGTPIANKAFTSDAKYSVPPTQA